MLFCPYLCLVLAFQDTAEWKILIQFYLENNDPFFLSIASRVKAPGVALIVSLSLKTYETWFSLISCYIVSSVNYHSDIILILGSPWAFLADSNFFNFFFVFFACTEYTKTSVSKTCHEVWVSIEHSLLELIRDMNQTKTELRKC